MAAPIALVGMACRFPGRSNSPSAFWTHLLSGQSAIREIPADRFSIAAHVDANAEAPGKSYSRWGGFIDDIAGFDPAMFEISPREAQTMDPQQRLLLMVAYEAMQDAGLTRSGLGAARTGVYVGVSASDYAAIQRQQRTYSDVYSGTGSALSIVSNRLSHRFDLNGPSLSIDTACSSSLVALDQAVAALNSGRIDIAIVAGAHLLIDPSTFVAFSKAGMLSPTGRLAAFDRRANGYVRGEGIGAVVLLRTTDALHQADRIRALVRATASNQDGRTPTLTAPHPAAQRAMMRQLVEAAGVSPRDVHYVEAHGTGTPIGDPIEASAIGHVFGGASRGAPLLIGSVKPSIGHLEAAAGIASLIKAVLTLEHRCVPASVNFEDPNPAIAFAAHNMTVPRTATALDGDQSLLIAVNSFGFGGTNAGALLESVSQTETAVPMSQGAGRSVAVPISAASAEALRALAGNLHDAVAQGELAGRNARDIAASLGHFREGLGHRAAVIAGTDAELLSGLSQIAEDAAPAPVSGRLPPVVLGKARPVARLAFTFAGQGGQWPGMARRLLVEEPAFAAAFNAFDRLFEALSGWPVRPEILREGAASRLGQSRFAMPAIFGVQLGLGALWRSWGMTPDFVIGHSFGELAAAHLAGAIDLETATRMIHVRCQIRERIGKDGSMLAVGLAPADISHLLGADSPIDVAAINTDEMVTLAGPVEAIAALSEKLAREQPAVLVRALQSDTAWHSRQLEPLEDWFRSQVGDVDWRTPKVDFVSTVSGRVESRLDADYWWRNLRQPVLYRNAVMMALDLGADSFLELSPHRVLSGLNATNGASRGASVTIANSLVRDEDDFHTLAVATAQLHAAGFAMDWPAATGGTAHVRGLPTYPWQLSPHWRHSEEARDLLHTAPVHPLLGKRERGPDPIWTSEISLAGFPYLRDHVVGGELVFPATGYLEMMLCAGRELFGDLPLELEDFEISAALFIEAEEHVLVSTRYDLSRHRAEVRTRTRGGSAEWTVRASACLRPTDLQPELSLRSPDATAETITGDAFYASTAQAGFAYGSAFAGVTQARVGGESGLSVIETPAHVSLDGSLAHPATLDAALQLAIPILSRHPEVQSAGGVGTTRYVPKRLRRLRFSGSLPRQIAAQAHVTRNPSGTLSASYRLADTDGQCRLVIEGLELSSMGRRAAAAEPEQARPAFYAESFIPHEIEEQGAIGGDWLILSGNEKHAAGLADRLGKAGARVSTQILASAAPDGQDLLEAIRRQVLPAIVPAQTIVFDAAVGDVTEDNLVARSEDLVLRLIGTAQAVQSLEPEAAPRELIVVTQGARRLPDDAAMDLAGLAAAPLVGLVRTIASENPGLVVRQIDYTPDTLPELVDVLSGAGAETELVVRDGQCWAPRLVSESREDLPRGLVDIESASASETFKLTMKTPGSSGGLFLEASPVQQPASGEVLVETAAVGLNFRDVMAVTGLLPAGAEPDPAWLNLGLEFSGTVREVGPGVSGLAPGDRIMGMGRGCLRGLLVAPAAALTKVPADLNFSEAATIPSAFSTAHYALVHAGRLQAGERVLIHMGTGGVGLAAIQVARALGAEIFATAGSEIKRNHLRSLGIRHVSNSRSLGFADDVMAATGGKGVDVVLNALPAHFIAKGLDVLAPFGRFLEIGKRDVYDDAAVGMHALRRNISFNVIDLAAMGAQRPDLLGSVLREVLARFEEGTYRPLPVTDYPIDHAAGAFDLMAKGRHIGKIVIGIGKEKIRARASVKSELNARRDRSYLVTGGTRGFGVEIARWLARHGAGGVILASRSGQLDEKSGLYAELQAIGCQLETVALDVTDTAAIETFIHHRALSGRPIAGIVHGAAVFKDGLLGQLDETSVRAVLRPKIAGAWALHRAFQKSGAELDFFLSLSSVAQVLGSLGQANYVAANSFLEGFAAYRAARGLAAQVVNLGALAEAGFVAENAAMGSYLDSMGVVPMGTGETLDLLDGLTASSATARCIAAIDWGRVQSASGMTGVTPRVAGLMPGSLKGDDKLRQLLEALPVDKWTATLQDFLVAEVSRVLGVGPELVPVNRPLAELGLDSLSSIELKNRIEAKLALSLTIGAFLQAPTLEKLASVIAATLEQQSRTSRDAGDNPTSGGPSGAEASFAPFQNWAMRLALAPMTSSAGRAALERAVHRSLEPGLNSTELAARLARLCSNIEALSLSWSAEKSQLVRGTQPQFALVANAEAATSTPLALEDGELVRVVIVERDGIVTHIGIRMHLAVGLEPGVVIDALIQGDEELPGIAEVVREAEEDVAAEANSRALLEPWIAAPALPGASLAVTGCLDGLNTGHPAHLPLIETAQAVTEAQGLLAFAQALGAVLEQPAVMIERFTGPLGQSVPIRVVLDADAASALSVIEHQLGLAAVSLDACALELKLADELDAAGVRLRQFGFSYRSADDPAPLDWNAVALHMVRSEATTRIGLAFDPRAIDALAVEKIAARLQHFLGLGHVLAKPACEHDPAVTLRPDGSVSARAVPAATTLPLRGYPVTEPLANLLDGVSDPRASETLRRASLICQAIRIRPGVDVTRLQRAVRTLVDRHGFLRSHFVRQEQQWRVQPDATAADLLVMDMAQASTAEIEAEARTIAARPYHPGRPPLVEFHLLRGGKGGDLVIVRLFEGIADGWSIGLILDELLKAYLGLDLGPRPPAVPQILQMAGKAGSSGSARLPRGAGVDRSRLGPNRILTIRLKGADPFRQLAKSLGTTENGLLAAAFALALEEAGHHQVSMGTYDPARNDPELHRAVAFLSRLVMLDLPRDAGLPQVSQALDAQFLDLATRPTLVGDAPKFIYAPLLPRHMLEQSLFGPAMRKLSMGRISVMSMEVETLDIAPTGLQEGRLQLRPLPIDGRLDLRLHYDIATYSQSDIAELGRRVVALTGLPPSTVEDERLSDVIGAEPDLALGS